MARTRDQGIQEAAAVFAQWFYSEATETSEEAA